MFTIYTSTYLMSSGTDSVKREIQPNSLYFVCNVDHQNPNVMIDLCLRVQRINSGDITV